MLQSKISFIVLLLVLLFTISNCGISPEPINYGKDECEHCRMLISDNRYGAEMISDKGKVYKFDSIECLVAYAVKKIFIGDDSFVVLIANFSDVEKLVDAKSAFYIHNDNFRSPMGLNISAFGTESEMQEFLTKNGGRKLTWFDVIEMVKQNTM